MKLQFRIPGKLPRFEGERALLVVAGKQAAIFYEGRDGELMRLDAFKIPNPRFLDREGEFKTRGRMGVVRSGGIREYGDENIIRDFLHEFEKRFRALGGGFQDMYIFAPTQMQKKIADSLPQKERQKIRKEFTGNFYYRPALSLLERIADADLRPFMARDEEEGKILRVPRQK